MDMKELAEILEDELAEAVEVKNRKSLHRYIMLLVGQHVDKESHDNAVLGLRSDIDKSIQSMKDGFQRMDERFTQMQKQMDERFEAHERRFDDMTERFNGMQKLIGVGFAAMAFIVAAFNIAILLA
ncbi:MAG: hypothetical protein R6V67_09710 [Spirochaetia bacterium]